MKKTPPPKYPKYPIEMTSREDEKILNQWIGLAEKHDLPWNGELPSDDHPAMISLQKLHPESRIETLREQLSAAIGATLN